MMDRNSARDYIRQHFSCREYLEESKGGMFCCPFCGSGHGKKGTGAVKLYDTNTWTCHSCGKSGDVIDLYRQATGTDYNGALTALAAQAGITLDKGGYALSWDSEIDLDYAAYRRQKTEGAVHTDTDTHNSIHTSAQEQQADDQGLISFYRQAAARLEETDYYLQRGLSLDLCRKYMIGYCPDWKHPKAPKSAPATPRLIIPISNSSYLARDTRKEIPADQQEYKKGKVKAADTVTWTFNSKALYTSSTPVFVVEGEIDALSIIEAGGQAVAIGSTANTKRFTNELAEAGKLPAAPLVISLDNDTAGQAAQEQLQKYLEAAGIISYRYNIAGKYKDVNEMLLGNRQDLEAKIVMVNASEDLGQTLEEIQRIEAAAEYRQNSVAAHLQEFLNGIAASVNTPAIETGFTNLDKVLEGGLYEGLYTIGAISSLGKTTLVMQIADQIAQAGTDVLVFSLEMARTELMAKSISRHTLQEVLGDRDGIKNAKTARGITSGKRYANYSQEESSLIQTAVTKYAEYADHIYITEGIGDIGVNQIRETVKQHISITGNTPVIVVDYLQILAPYNERSTDKQNTDKAVLELKRISRDYKTPVIAISSLNRQNYSEKISMEAFKESGAIEYSSDVLIGLQLKGAGEKGFNVNEAKGKDPREVQLVILKNRSGKTGSTIELNYYPMFNYFQEA